MPYGASGLRHGPRDMAFRFGYLVIDFGIHLASC
jgi:hypothetical protein